MKAILNNDNTITLYYDRFTIIPHVKFLNNLVEKHDVMININKDGSTMTIYHNNPTVMKNFIDDLTNKKVKRFKTQIFNYKTTNINELSYITNIIKVENNDFKDFSVEELVDLMIEIIKDMSNLEISNRNKNDEIYLEYLHEAYNNVLFILKLNGILMEGETLEKLKDEKQKNLAAYNRSRNKFYEETVREIKNYKEQKQSNLVKAKSSKMIRYYNNNINKLSEIINLKTQDNIKIKKLDR